MERNKRFWAAGDVALFPASDEGDVKYFDVLLNDDGTDRSWFNPRYGSQISGTSEKEVVRKAESIYGPGRVVYHWEKLF